ncbi:MAG: signal recognition particle protein [Alphaproteobacteria bacterium CG_4_10_14_0_2_um_filter_63_37]|nr:MAG: signal recognition particle protein [Proteobacteria bacterium CG1_02_64_396]PJA24618.1 MAG: signal recognition particle protein [Alphaproteobacteria bacterium CG_4_10_14_0_2_um_filter_63_37]
MFDQLTERFDGIFKRIRGRGALNDENIADALRQVRMALLEADVALSVVRDLLDKVRERALGQEVVGSLNPGQVFVKIVHEELTAVMGQAVPLELKAQPPAVVMLVGLQGSGKTTTAAKLAKLLGADKKKVAMVSADIYRPGAIEQLASVGAQVGAEVIPSSSDQKPVDIARRGLDAARKMGADVLLLDAAGRLHVDEAMMEEIVQVAQAAQPVETLLVVDAMTGQDVVKVAQAFQARLNLTGVVLTKTDGDARGGAALSLRHVTGLPIKYLGTGEKLDGIAPFHPERMAGRILGMGDVVSLVEKVQGQVDAKKAEQLAKKLKKKGLDLNDLRDQLASLRKMGSLRDMVGMIPGAGKLMGQIADEDAEKQMKRMEAILSSMTMKERERPEIINPSRKRRIAAGSGTALPEVNRLLKQFDQMQKMMKKAGKMGKRGGMGMPGMPRMPGGGFPFR